MKILSVAAGVILVAAIMVISACRMQDTGSQPYEYTITGEIKKVEYYESERIKDAERTAVVNLEQLGYSDLELAGGEEAESPAIEYTLPDGATQGPDKWYIIDFHFLIEFEEDTGGGFCDVQASPSGSVELETMKVNEAPFVRVGGQSVTSTRVEVHYYNYMTLSSVKPGINEMTFKYKEYQGTKVKKVTIYKDTGITVTTTAPSEYEEGQKVTGEEKEKAREIAFKDARVREMVEGKEYAERITKASDMIKLASEPPDDDIEVRLVFAQKYMIEDIEASALDIFVDLNEGAVTDVFPLGTSGMPELTASEKERAAAIAMSNDTVKGLLAGKGYEITRIGICQGGPVGRLGANMDIIFDKAYPFKGEFPHTATDSYYLDSEIEEIEVFVNLKEGKAVEIIDRTARLPGGGVK
jgi:hypothetical protein